MGSKNIENAVNSDHEEESAAGELGTPTDSDRE